MTALEALFSEARAKGYPLDQAEFARLYDYAKAVHQHQQQQEEAFFRTRTPIAYPETSTTTTTTTTSWLSSLHARIEQELTGKFPQLAEIKDKKQKILSAVRERRLHPPAPKLPDLPDEAADVVKKALNSPPSLTLIERFFIPITSRDLRTLVGAAWLNDEVINFYFELIAERSAGRVHVMSTFFYPKLKDSGYAAVRRWTKKVDIFACDRVLIPVHLGVHWCLAEVDLKGRRIVYYDSLHGSNSLCLSLLLEWLKAEHADKQSSPLPAPDEWQLLTPHHSTPAQQNGYDCGVFTCVTGEYRSRGAQLTFSQADMPYFRQRISYEILTGRLLV